MQSPVMIFKKDVEEHISEVQTLLSLIIAQWLNFPEEKAPSLF